ncbi:3-oxoacyl-[acyl-carrier protein] reductase [Lentibacillus persicus]|uniref:3-oxoacyl-[acyl-carrier protein] reductase n=1 Tax=Lentibacillus persicus TaxID=640948 RepID=A0A1I1TUP4_9BACI|nr:SDR family oxidoreductase [Lentibacillus persicus]SFD60968.1 3-oxoacyl-[acyl-carrier protein] reductase [Lentibacillus persicus]
MGHALVTAGTSGLGKQVVKKFLEAGFNVTTTYHKNAEKAEAVQNEFQAYSHLLHIEQTDVTKKGDIVNLVNNAADVHGGVDYLINNAGPFVFERKKLLDYSDEEWHEMINGNLDAVFYLLKEILPHMRKQRFGRIINYGFQEANNASGWPYRAAFAAAKSGLVSLTKTIALEEAENQITSNMVCPGNIVGDMKEAEIEESRKMTDDKTPIGRPGTGEDIARAILYLCDQNSDMITGSIFEITGGIDVINRYR